MDMNRARVSAVVLLGACALALGATPEATPVGWSAMTLEHLPLLKRAKMFQWSSFSHPSANSNEFYYPDPNASGYKVMMDMKGSGCLYNWWSTGEMSGNVQLRVYLDGSTTPAITTSVSNLANQFSGVFGMNWPCVSFVPIAFRSGCVVSTNFPAGQSCPTLAWGCEEFFHWYAHSYPTPDGVATYTGTEDRSAIQAIWNNVGADPKSTVGNLTVQGTAAVAAGQSVTIFDRSGQESIASIKIDPTPSDSVTMQSTRIRCYWDGSATPQVDVPLSWFFGSADKGETATSHTVPVGMSTTGHWYCYFPMPYWTAARVEIANAGSTPVTELRYDVQYKPSSVISYPKESSGYFCAVASNRYNGLHEVLDTVGTGHIVGITWKGRTGENDEMCWIDDNNTPQFWGTGGEDYPLFCYGMGTGSYPMRSGWSDWRWSRYHISDAIPFSRSIRFGWESRENHNQGWLTPVGSSPGWNSVCLFYFRPDPVLVLTDSLDVGNATSESAHTYSATSAATTSKTYEYQGDFDAWGTNNQDKLVTDNGRIVSGTSQFTVTILPDNDGVRLMRRMDQSTIQLARVFVDNVEVTESRYYTPINYRSGEGFYDTDQLFRDVEFEIPAAYTAGKSSIVVRMENLRPPANGGDWTEFYYWVYSYKTTAAATTPPSIVTHPQNARVTEGATVSFVVEAVGAQSYQWQEDGVSIAGQISSTLALQSPQLSQSGNRYRCVVTNAHGSVTSNEATLTVTADTQAPTLVSAAATSATTVDVVFSEPVESASGDLVGNYSITGGVAVMSAQVSTQDPSVVTLTTAALTSGQTYTVQVSNIRDRASTPNTIAPGASATFLFSPYEQGLNVAYYELSSPTALPDFSQAVAKKDGTIPNFELSVADRANDYALRYTGYVEIPADGLYTFYTSSDDGSRLYMDGAAVVNNDGNHNVEERSGQVQLSAGMHAIVVDYFNACCGATLVVSWQGPGIAKAPIPNTALWRTAGGIVSARRQAARGAAEALTVPQASITRAGGVLSVVCRYPAAYHGSTGLALLDMRGRMVVHTKQTITSQTEVQFNIGKAVPTGRYVAIVQFADRSVVLPFVTVR